MCRRVFLLIVLLAILNEGAAVPVSATRSEWGDRFAQLTEIILLCNKRESANETEVWGGKVGMNKRERW